jgi:hypothetical protein
MVDLAADALRFGMNPEDVMDRGKEDFLLNLAILKKVSEHRAEEKREELLALSKLIASELAQILGALFR